MATRTRVALIVAGLLAAVCVGAAGLSLVMLAQTPAGQVTFWRAWMVQRSARVQACSANQQVVPGSYEVDAVRSVAGYAVVTYAAECVEPGGHVVATAGYVAQGANGGCGGAGSGPARAGSAGAAAIEGLGTGTCGGPGLAGSLTVVYGRVAGATADTVEVSFADGTIVSEPVGSTGRFAAVVAGTNEACGVRALDASGNEVIVQDMGWLRGGPGASGCR